MVTLTASPLRNGALAWLTSGTQQGQEELGRVKEHHCLRDLCGASLVVRNDQCLNARRNEVGGVGWGHWACWTLSFFSTSKTCSEQYTSLLSILLKMWEKSSKSDLWANICIFRRYKAVVLIAARYFLSVWPSLSAGVWEKKHLRSLSAGGFCLCCAEILTKGSFSGENGPGVLQKCYCSGTKCQP